MYQPYVTLIWVSVWIVYEGFSNLIHTITEGHWKLWENFTTLDGRFFKWLLVEYVFYQTHNGALMKAKWGQIINLKLQSRIINFFWREIRN